MPRRLTLKKKRDFDIVFKKGKRRFSKNFTLVYADSDEFFCAIITQKKIIPKASHRNYSRRLVKEILHTNNDDIQKKCLKVVVLIKTDLKELRKTVSFVTLEHELTSLLKQL